MNRYLIAILSILLFASINSNAVQSPYKGPKFTEKMVKLAHGDTYYKKLEVQPGAPYLVFVHGGTVYCSHGSFDEYMLELSAKGQNVLCFDQYGSGKSSAWLDQKKFNQVDFEAQLNELINTLPETKPHQNVIIGSSAGACITARYTASNPEKVRKVGFISPAIDVMSTKGAKDRFGIWLFKQFPKSDFLHGMLKDLMQRRTKEVVHECPKEVKTYIGELIDKEVQDEQFVKNFYRKVIGNVFADCRQAFKDVVTKDVPFFAASGAQDTEVPIKMFRDTFKEYASVNDTYLEFQEAGHGLQCRESSRLISEIAQFVRKPKKPVLRAPASVEE